MTCDRVAMVFGGAHRSVGPLGELLSARLLSTEVVLRPRRAAAWRRAAAAGGRAPPDVAGGAAGGIELPEEVTSTRFLRAALAAGRQVVSVLAPPRVAGGLVHPRGGSARRRRAGVVRAGAELIDGGRFSRRGAE